MKQDELQTKDSFDEARALFEKMTGEARRQIEAESRDARNRSPFVKILLALTITACLSAAITLFYGIYAFADAPIRQTNESFAGKQGQPRTREDFEKFKFWEKALFVSFGSAFMFGIAFGILDSREKRRRQTGKIN